MPELDATAPIAIGGIGGGGTRVVARLLQLAGLYLGSDLNDALDNLWFTLLFKRRSVLVDDSSSLEALLGGFYARMRDGNAPDALRDRVGRLADAPRPQHDALWLGRRRDSFVGADAGAAGRRWGWKEPNSFIIADRLLDHDPALTYVHVVRNAFDMALSTNQNQPRLWGDIFVDGLDDIDATAMLAYWCAVHRRLERLVEAYGDRIVVVRYDDLVAAPREAASALAVRLGLGATGDALATFAAEVTAPLSLGRHRTVDPALFRNPADIAYAADWGFPLTNGR